MAKAKKKSGAPGPREFSWSGNSDLWALVEPISGLREDTRNARLHDDRNISAIRSSLERFGQQKPIVVTSDGVVIAGNGTLRAAIAMGWNGIAVVRSALSNMDARAYALADNRTAELAEWNPDALRAELKDLFKFDVSLPLDIGWSEPELEKILFDGEEHEASSNVVGHVVYKVIVTCKDEADQAAMIQDLEGKGYEVVPFMA